MGLGCGALENPSVRASPSASRVVLRSECYSSLSYCDQQSGESVSFAGGGADPDSVLGWCSVTPKGEISNVPMCSTNNPAGGMHVAWVEEWNPATTGIVDGATLFHPTAGRAALNGFPKALALEADDSYAFETGDTRKSTARSVSAAALLGVGTVAGTTAAPTITAASSGAAASPSNTTVVSTATNSTSPAGTAGTPGAKNEAPGAGTPGASARGAGDGLTSTATVADPDLRRLASLLTSSVSPLHATVSEMLFQSPDFPGMMPQKQV